MMQTLVGEGSIRGYPLHPGGRSQGYGAQHSDNIGNFVDQSGQYNPRMFDSPDAYPSRQWQQEPVNTWSQYGGTPQSRRSEQCIHSDCPTLLIVFGVCL